jgi:hypothetical protein
MVKRILNGRPKKRINKTDKAEVTYSREPRDDGNGRRGYAFSNRGVSIERLAAAGLMEMYEY